jgi:hypothetical protein
MTAMDALPGTTQLTQGVLEVDRPWVAAGHDLAVRFQTALRSRGTDTGAARRVS